MMGKRPRKVVSYNMSRIRSKGTKLEARLEEILKSLSIRFVKHPKVFGKPDFAYQELKIAIFADSDFWHGFEWEVKKREIKTNQGFWIQKIERNMERDIEVTRELTKRGWHVLRFWGHDITSDPDNCCNAIEKAVSAARKKGCIAQNMKAGE